jgi:hypothetical protein
MAETIEFLYIHAATTDNFRALLLDNSNAGLALEICERSMKL